MTDCIFCRIVAGNIPANKVFEDDTTLAFADIQPQAPTHLLIIPKPHVSSLATTQDAAMLGHLLTTAAALAHERGLTDTGYRLVTNHGADGGQSVDHLHFHLLGGRPLRWPPG